MSTCQLKDVSTRCIANRSNVYSILVVCNVMALMCSLSRYPIVNPRAKCSGDKEQQPGVRSYGFKDAREHFDVYCYMDRLRGEKHWPRDFLLESPNLV